MRPNYRRVSRIRELLLVACCLVCGSGAESCAGAAAIEFWHPWPHADKTVRSLAAEYQHRTGVAVHVRVFNPSSYNPWSRGASPDIIGLSRPTDRGIESLAAAGRLYNLQAQIGRGWYSRFWPGFLETFYVRRGSRTSVYGVPITGEVYVFVYNKRLFKKANVGSITDWQSLMSAADRLRRIGVMPYAGGFSSDRPPLAHAYEWSYLGLHNLIQTYAGKYPYTAKDWVSEFSLYTEMYNYGFTNASWATVSETSAAKLLIDGRTGMIFMGPSFEIIRRAYKPRFKDWGIMRVPFDPRAKFLPRSPGRVMEGVVISSRSPRKGAAIAFVSWLTETRQEVEFANGSIAIPATPSGSTSSSLKSEIRQFVAGMQDQQVDLRPRERSDVLRAQYAGVRKLLAGRTKPYSVAAYTNSVKRR